MLTPNEICKILKRSFKSKAQMLRCLVIENGGDFEQYKKRLGVTTTTALTDEKLDELIFAEYEGNLKSLEDSER